MRVLRRTPRTFVLHVGTHKTATTSLQSTFRSARAELASRGTLYPETGQFEAGHHNIAWGLAGDDRFDPDAGFLDELAEEIRDHRLPRVLVSSEDLEYLNDREDRLKLLYRWIRRLGYEPLVIITLRDEASYLESLYVELVAHGFFQSFDEFVEGALSDRRVVYRSVWDFRLDYEALVAGFTGVFGRRRVAVIRYDPLDMIGRFWQSFPELLGREDAIGGIDHRVRLNRRRGVDEVNRNLAEHGSVQPAPNGTSRSAPGSPSTSTLVELPRLSTGLRERVAGASDDQIDRLVRQHPPTGW